ncbi:putative Very-long-chain 3-oxoacyl-CoA reductase-A [Hypsibius exemplaris]|uniref:Very-long-chain 3-oxoacyl-CoA reductase-A n=1 Tax=Hypsibius exemplaris TaxID=2072580 RepID=A0A1W0X8S0_HYPEX|nr:putative Very-long-chain 3-oxoacyl-CoA reductase-A [Hypsibius exemplaris]
MAATLLDGVRLQLNKLSLKSVNERVDNYFGSSRSYFAAFGAASLALVGVTAAYQVAKGVTTYCLAAPLALGINIRDYGEWAVVTGANDGIGRIYCLELARRGLNIVLIARDEEKLNVAARDVELTHHVKTKVIVADFANASLDMYNEIQSQLTGHRIGVLVNNVGDGGDEGLFLENPASTEGCLEMVNTNATSYVMMTRLILPGMVTRGKGIIICISSVNGDVPTPKAALYSGTKRFVDFFAVALNEEYRDKGIVVQSVLPGAVDTKMVQEEHRNSFWCVQPEEFVPLAISQLGVRTRTYGHWKHAVHIKWRKVWPGARKLI